ncbi:YtxH domain-containing protein [Candidatus Roizmanbacteria bacterium]|nr:YtxH domain-containing protein [Candidatus Roizmanbacteria bacterium]
MENQNSHKLSTFWFGFLLGGALTGSAAFLLGTKQGRKTLKKILEMSENIEETVQDLFEEYGDEIREKGSELFDSVKKLQKNHSHDNPPFHSLSGLLDRIKILSPSTQKRVKRFFVKEGKIIEGKST